MEGREKALMKEPQGKDAFDVLNEEEIARHHLPGRLGRPCYVLQEVDSTNERLWQLAKEGAPEGTLLVADRQSVGRGRRGRTWQNPPGEAVSMSFLLYPDLPEESVPLLTLAAALAAAEALSDTAHLSVRIKWPNDLVADQKKLCGILTERRLLPEGKSSVVVGIGINVHNGSFPPELSETATSVFLQNGSHPSRAALIASVLCAFETNYALLQKSGDFSLLMDSYNALLVNRGRAVCVRDPRTPFCGTAEGVNACGELLVDTKEGRRTVRGGEVSVRGIYGYV